MKQPDTPPEEPWEKDAVWELLDQSPTLTPPSRFLDNTVRAARLSTQTSPAWWTRVMAPAPISSLTGAIAALALAFSFLNQPDSRTTQDTPSSDNTAHIEEIAETETLIAAIDHMDDFSDMELVSLIGF